MLAQHYSRLRTRVGRHKSVALIALRVRALALGMRVNSERRDNEEVIRITDGDRSVLLSSHHYPYVQDIMDDFDYYFDAVRPRVEAKGSVVDYSRPAEHALRPSGKRFFFTSLPEVDLTTSLYLDRAQLGPGHVVFDLGAYCGATACSFSELVGEEGRVFAFEPDTRNYLALTKNIETHGLSNVTPINKGVWSTTTSVLFEEEGSLGSAVATVTGRQTSLHAASMVSLDDVVNDLGISRLDFVKMDIEGAEVTVLQSANTFWQQFHPRFVIEPHLVEGVVSTHAVCAILEKRGYQCEVVKQGHLRLPLIYASPQ